ncbi:hypothetical protein [Pelosinus propionicus]|uniref:Uncharacterized protein n=1 Tax=Pelosinus propionicus DSM 13327 TaxID=1123291 RepID=A0A1I4KB49_9FIRM|nr:hypothetical protein [Pelosinus propionicus]SFL75984.1 hypothetical protein SAMN04490355_1016105 [Pelosinus propionicus DSM 13327]
MKRIMPMILLCLILVVGAVTFSKEKHTSVAANPQQVTSREFKLLLKPDAFTTRNIGYQSVWECITSLAKERGIAVTENSNPYLEDEGTVTYLDTQMNDFYKQNYILRKRIQYDDGIPKKHGELMLKYRSDDVSLAAAADVASSLGVKAKDKLEQDVNMDGNHIGSLQGVFSHSNSIKKIQLPVGNSVADYAAFFPGLAKLASDDQTVLLPVNDITAHEYSISPGSLDFHSGLLAKVELSVWYTDGKESPEIGEISFSYSLKNASPKSVAESESFFKELQKRIEANLLSGMTKTEFVYSDKK